MKKKSRKRGFTLIELLATITILGILLGIAIPSVMGYMNRGKETYYHSLEDSVLNSARDYLIDYRSLYPREIGNTATISGDELLNNKYITNINDEDGKKCDATVIVEKTDKDEYDYHVCLQCGDNYSSSEEVCNMVGNQGQTKNYVIEVDTFPTEVRQGDDLTLPKGKVYEVENGNKTLITDNLDSTPKTIDTTVLGTTNVRWIYRYKSTNPTSVRVVDKVAPERPTVKLKYPDGTQYQGRNSNGNINVTARSIIMEITSRDYACVLGTTCRSRYPNLEGSGVKEIRYKGETDTSDRIIPTTKTTTRYTENETLWGNVSLKAVDNSNNQSEEISFEIYLDNEAPSKTTVTYLGGSNSHSWKNNYKLKLSATDNIEVAYYEIYIDGNYYGTTGPEWTPPNNFSSCNTSFRAVDLAGNKGAFSDSQHIHMDTEAPSVPSVTYNGGSNSCSWKNNYNLTLSSTDNVGVDHYELDTNGDGVSDRTVSSNFIPENNFSSCTTRFRAVDAAGNRSAWTGNHHIHMDTQKPSVPSVTYNGGSNSCSWKNNYNLTLTSTDNVSIAYYESDGNGDGIADFTTASNFIPWNGFSSCTQRFRAVDVAGNVSDWTGNHHIHMDTENPVHNNWWWGEVTFQVARLYIQVSDNASGINRIQCPTSTQSGGYNNWYWYNAVWDSGANAYRCDITPSTFGHYNQTYQTHLYIYDNAGNGGYYNQTSVAIPQQFQPVEFNYTGKVQKFTAPYTGKFKLEVWGAEGGGNTSRTDSSHSGLGGYSQGTISLTQGQTLYIYVGGHPTYLNGGWNGGGDSHDGWDNGSYVTGFGGGGATDIALYGTEGSTTWNTTEHLHSRIIVAGGGGGADNRLGTLNSTDDGSGGDGGGIQGSPGRDNGVLSGKISTQTSGNAFGYGGGPGSIDNGGGGGGWYGGYRGTDTNSGGGGGSGYVYTASTASYYPNTLLNNSFYLTNASTTAGNRYGNGMARISAGS